MSSSWLLDAPESPELRASRPAARLACYRRLGFIGAGDAGRAGARRTAEFLALLSDVVRATGLLDLVGEVLSGERAVEVADELEPDIVLIDVRMPGLGGVAAARRIKSSRPSTVVVLMSTTHPNDLSAEEDGTDADAWIWKNDLSPGLLDEIWLRRRGPMSLPAFHLLAKPTGAGCNLDCSYCFFHSIR
jgi:CheY-like chemotaxis protein